MLTLNDMNAICICDGQWAFATPWGFRVELNLAPWVKEKYADVYPGDRFMPVQFEIIVSDIQSCFSQFNKLRDKYRI